MKKPKDYELALAVVGAVLNDWDPYDLISGGAPSDEFESEISAVVSQIPRIKGPNDAANAVSRVFSSAFDNETFAPENCTDIGIRLHAALSDAKLIDA